MKKRRQRRGLVRNKPLTTSLEEYRVLSINKETQEILLVGNFDSLEIAKEAANDHKDKDIDIYVHGSHNRVLYSV